MKNFSFLLIIFSCLLCACSSDDPDSGDIREVLITPNVGLSTITFNDDGNKVMSEYGMYERLTSVGGGGQTAFVMWFENGLGFQLDHIDTPGLSLQEIVDMSDDLIDLNQKVIQIIIMSPFEAMTTEGISLGSSRAEVHSFFGDPDSQTSSTETFDDINMNFWYNSSDIVRRIDLFK